MKIAFFTEMNFRGKIPRNHQNMRVEFSWMCALEADHYPIGSTLNQKYDLVIIIIPKKGIKNMMNQDHIGYLKIHCAKVAVMQEGPSWFFQDYTLEQQIWYINTLVESDIIYAHNKSDKLYFEGLIQHSDVRVMPSLMIEDNLSNITAVPKRGTIIGGNFVSWYGGIDSYMVAQEFGEEIFAPSMGRKQPNEEQILHHLPYMEWTEWMQKLNTFKYGVHLMRTQAAGTFALNCSILGIPCIGYKGLDTQEILHPQLTVEIGDLVSARKLARKLKGNSDFHKENSILTQELYREYYTEQKFLEKFKYDKD
jgi:hypothetical protein